MSGERVSEPLAGAHVDRVARIVGAELALRFGLVNRTIDAFAHDAEPLSPASIALGLMLVAAHELVHDGATEEDAIAMARAAWRKAIEVHSRGCGDA